MPRPISAEISVPAMAHNLSVVANQLRVFSKQNQLPSPKIWAVIKANAYGHGIDQGLQGFAQADGLAMLDLNEAVACRDRGWEKPILLLEGYFEPADLRLASDYKLSVVIHDAEQLNMLMANPPKQAIQAWVKLNTGMNRLGFSPNDYAQAYQKALHAQKLGYLSTVGKMTHFARADDSAEVTQQQLNLFHQVCADLPGPVSVCNSAATLTPEYWLAANQGPQQWVRPGICLYGSSPFPDKTAANLGLQPVMTLKANIIGVHDITAGSGMGYGHRFVADRDMRIGVVACGYADGYPRHAPDGTPVQVAGRRSRLLGRLSMDMLLVDLSHIPEAKLGSQVVLWGEGGPSVDEVAQASGTIGYELVCAIAQRVPKIIIPLASKLPQEAM